MFPQNLPQFRRPGFVNNGILPNRLPGLVSKFDATSNVYMDGAVQFTTADKAYLSCASNSTLQTGGNNFSFTAWVYMDTIAGQHKTIISKANLSTNREYDLYVKTDGKVQLDVWNGGSTLVGSVTSTETLSTSTWYFIYAEHYISLNRVGISVNNGTITTSALTGTCAISTAPVCVGANPDSGTVQYFNGRIDSLSFQKYIPTGSEISRLYNSGAGRMYDDLTSANGLGTFASNLISWWGFNEEDGIRYDAKGTNHLSQTFVNIIDSSTPLLNGGFETLGGGGADVWGSWTESTAGASTLTDEGVLVHAGSHAAKFVVDGSNSAVSIAQTVLTTGHKYSASVWARGAVGSEQIIIGDTSTNWSTPTLTAAYAQYSGQGTAGATSFNIKRSSASQTFYIDDVTLACAEIPAAAGIAAGLARDGNLCASFNGTSQYLSRASTASLQTGDIDFTVWGWVYLNVKNAQQAIIGKWNTGSNAREWVISYVDTSDRVRLSVTSDGTAGTTNSVEESVTGSPSVDAWYFFVAYHDSVNNLLGISLNNSAGSTTAHSAGVFSSATASLVLGAIDGGSLKLNGRVDGVGFIKRLLTPTEKTSLFNLGRGVKYAGLPATMTDTISFWNLDEYSASAGAVTRNDSQSTNHLTDTGKTPSGQGVNYYEGTVSKWIDGGSAIKNLTQTTQSSRLLYRTNQINSRAVITGDGLTKYLTNSNDLIGTGNVTIVAVIKPRGWGGTSAGEILDTTTGILRLVSASSYVQLSRNGATLATSAVSSISLNTAYVIVVTSTSAGTTNFYINGALSGTADQSAGSPTAGGATYLGNRADLTRGFDGDIGTVQVFNRILPTNQITAYTKYLRNKWGI